MGVLRTWMCLNRRCGGQFDAWEDYPSCPTCGGARTSWVPGGGHIKSGMTAHADATFRDLAEVYGMTDIASAREGERAMPKVVQPSHTVPQQTFAPGFVGAPFALDAGGRAHSVCQPSATGVAAKITAPVGKALGRSATVPGPQAYTQIEGRHRG